MIHAGFRAYEYRRVHTHHTQFFRNEDMRQLMIGVKNKLFRPLMHTHIFTLLVSTYAIDRHAILNLLSFCENIKLYELMQLRIDFQRISSKPYLDQAKNLFSLQNAKTSDRRVE